MVYGTYTRKITDAGVRKFRMQIMTFPSHGLKVKIRCAVSACRIKTGPPSFEETNSDKLKLIPTSLFLELTQETKKNENLL